MKAFPWPSGKRFAVSLTYDDGKTSQLETAIPALDHYQFKATFFLTGDWVAGSDKALWRAAGARGHELAGHGMRHACSSGIGKGWLDPHDMLEAYDLGRMADELDANLKFLKGLDAGGPFSFAYPCGETWVGPGKESYVHLVRERFAAARGGGEYGLADPSSLNLWHVPSLPAHECDLLATVEDARAKGSWAVFLFHGVGADNSPVTAETHQALLNRLSRLDDVWVAAFGEAAKAVAAYQQGNANA